MARAGRPVDTQRTELVLQAVGELVIEKTIAGLSMEGIAKRAGVSKVTLYRRYADLPGLIMAYVNFHTDQALNAAPQLAKPPAPLTDRQALQDHLSALGYQVLSLITRPDVVLFDNAVSAAQRQYPDIAAALYQAGPAKVLSTLSKNLAEYLTEHHLSIETDAAAQMLFTLWKGGFYEELQMTGRMRLSPKALQEHVNSRTGWFLAMLHADS